jgi:hypothetical protein
MRALRRRLLILVDTSDSCSELEAERRNALRTIGLAMASDDRCAVWVMGRIAKAYDGVEPGAAGVLEQVRGGTWIGETLSAALAEPAAAGERAFVVVVSDGEIFDADQLQPRFRIGFFRVGSRESSFLDIVRKSTIALRTVDDIKHFFRCVPPDVALDLRWSGGDRASRYDAEGNVIEDDPDPTAIDSVQDYVRVVMVGGKSGAFLTPQAGREEEKAPRPQLTYCTDGTSWIDDDVTVAPLRDDAPLYVHKVMRRLGGDRLEWNRGALSLLLSARGEVPLHCPRCGPDYSMLRQKQSLYCDVCSGLLVTTTGVRHSQLPDKLHDFVRFAIVGGELQMPPEPTELRTDCAFEVKTDAGRQWLVLNFRPS